MSIPPKMKMFGENRKPEKYLLRQAFANTGLLPDEILWRHKCAFSDGVSNIKNSWHKTLREFIDSKISNEEFLKESQKIKHCTPLLKESYFYRKIYNNFFGECEHLIPHFWMPKWTDAIDPSARELEDYQE
jgi:asparagine synthase (glutamine-hydrolysing)